MTDKHVLVQHSTALNATIHKIFETTQRIKFTAFDVSKRYVIFGVSSGGIYIFSRETCEFLKLIPNTHGPPNLLSVSTDEQYLAVAVSSGVIAVFENCFNSGEFLQQVFREHEGNNVTVMKWSGYDLYSGDSTGRVSAVTLKHFLKKTIFQAPAACLMQLDSSIVQLDTYSHFLLVSTKVRCLICDTETERYKQIGKRNRIGDFGACFLNLDKENDVTIYCARPKLRLWQSDFNGNVLLTLDFRPSISEKSSDVIYWDSSRDARLQIFPGTAIRNVEKDLKFGKLFQFLHKFVLNLSENGINVFDPSSSTLICYINHITNIKDIKIINEFIYIWYGELNFTILSLLTLEEIVMLTLVKRQYNFCADLCAEFFKDIISVIETSPKIHYLSALETNIKDSELFEKLEPIFKQLKEYNKTLSLNKMEHTVVTVHPPLLVSRLEVKKEEVIDTRNQPQSILFEQYKINELHKTIQTSNFTQLVESLSSCDIYELFMRFQEEIGEESRMWCKEMFLNYVNVSELTEPFMFKYACEVFFALNETSNLSCSCKFPLPQAHAHVPKHYEKGYELMKKSPNRELFHESVPYMYRSMLENVDCSNISLMVQFSDLSIFEALGSQITYDIWDEIIKNALKLKQGRCLNCGKPIDSFGSLSINGLGIIMIRSIKSYNTIELFKTYADELPRHELDPFFHQYCIFMSVANVSSPIFNEMVKHQSARQLLSIEIGKYLRMKHFGGISYEARNTEMTKNCDYCSIELKTPIIDEIANLKCGHDYHQLCFVFNGQKCQICHKDN